MLMMYSNGFLNELFLCNGKACRKNRLVFILKWSSTLENLYFTQLRVDCRRKESTLFCSFNQLFFSRKFHSQFRFQLCCCMLKNKNNPLLQSIYNNFSNDTNSTNDDFNQPIRFEHSYHIMYLIGTRVLMIHQCVPQR